MARIETGRWLRVSAVLDDLLEADRDQRAARLALIRHDDAGLADEVALLLGQQTALDAERFLEGTALDLDGSSPREGQLIGNYTLERPIGEGGMGVVWLARRSDGRFEGNVAVKFLNLGLRARGGAERFQREGSALARLAHPNIARLLDAGLADSHPYLVLEYVDGVPINQWCETQALDIRARMRLFLGVLAAVAHAHKNLILHRDLKPTNILVTHDGQVKLLDFGIAKLLEGQTQATAATELTQLSGRAFTPDYAAPEQIMNGAMTTATDVYSLGVILYELLTGARPYKPKRASTAALEEAIAEQEAPLASSVATKPEVRRQLRGDLDAILNQALKKRADQRYAAISDLRADIERYLDGLPVRAQPDRLGYRLAKFVLRNRVIVGASTAVLLAVLAGSAVSISQAREAHRQRDLALALSARNQAVVDFVTTMLTEVAPPEEPIRVADLLDRSVDLLTAGGSNPDHEAAILGTLASYFSSAGDKPLRAKELLDKSLALTRASEDQALRGNLLCDSAYAAQMAGRTREAAADVEEGLRLTAHDNFAAAKCLGIRAGIARASSDPDGLLTYAQQALARLQAYPVAQPAEEASYLDMIAAAYAARGRTEEADQNFAASIEKLAEGGRAESPRAGVIRNNWAVASYAAGNYRQAIANYDEALRIAQRWSIGGQAPAFLLSNRAKTLRELARYPEALEGFDRAIESAKQSGYANMRVDALVNRASTYLVMGDLAHSEQAMAQAKAEPGAAIDPNSPTGVSLKTVQARIDAARGNLPGAVASLSAVIDSYDSRKIVNGTLSSYLRQRADMYLQQGDLDAALSDAQRAVQMARSLQGTMARSSLTGLALMSVARVQERRGEVAQARKAAAEAVTHLTDTLGDEHPETQKARRVAEA